VLAQKPLQLEAAECDATPVSFTTLGLNPLLERAVADRGFVTTTPIQSAVFPGVLSGADLVACAQTGTGKTLAFLLPLMHRLLASSVPAAPPRTRVLVLAPTRELAVQIEDEFQGLAYHTNLSSVAVYGGVEAGPQERGLRGAADIVVATPGRLLDHMGSCAANFEGLEVLVLDEADRMLDMGFWPSVRRIVASLPESRQTLLFSATMSEEVTTSAMQIMRSPRMIRVGREEGLASTIEHVACLVEPGEKAEWLARFLKRTHGTSLVFVRTKRGADKLARRLAAGGIKCAPLHADRTQSERSAAVEGFKAGRYRALVATDIAARGIDIDDIAHVVNYEVPHSVDTYVHRVGRTGRAESTGTAVTLAGPEELAGLRVIEKALNVTFEIARAGAGGSETGHAERGREGADHGSRRSHA
jgi:ATP-dependent RNA helicase RhlE